MKRILVIGGGIGGLATSIRLASAGFDVQLFEASNRAGGKLNELRLDNFRFDTGPSLFTLPQLVDELFEMSEADKQDYIAYNRLDIICKYFYEDGTVINAWQDPVKFAHEIQEKTTDTASHILQFLFKSRQIYDLTAGIFIHSSFHDPATFFSMDFIKAVTRFYKLSAFSTMHQVISRSFNDSRVIQLFDRYATYNGSNPYKAPGTLNVIPHLEHNIGAYFPEEGMYSIASGLTRLAEKKGVQIHLNSKVKKIITSGSNIKGILTMDNTLSEGEIVVSDIDIVYLYKMLENYKIPDQYLKQERSTSALIFYWPVKKTFPQLELHNILFASDYREEFSFLFEKKEVYHDPTVYIFISSKKVKADAPEGCENWFVMINVPENNGQDWHSLRDTARQNIQKKINRILKTDIGSYISGEEVLDPPGIEEKTSSFHGSLYGASSNSALSAFRRHPNFSSKIRGLYFAGGSVHPGGGIPLCLASAKIVSGKIIKNHKF